ncbi:MAG: HlyD family efflux transporter periplasmic adaptor subunit [Planctomycetota bacterium]
MKRSSGFIKVTIAVAVLLCASVGIGSLLWKTSGPDRIGSDAITFSAFRGEYISSVNEVGDIESSSNFEIKCRVKSRGRAGTAILELVPEGTIVEIGDFLCQLDDSLLREELTERKIQVARDKSMVIQAESQLDAAQRKLEEYEKGSFAQEISTFDAAIKLAKERKERADEVARHSATLNLKGYLTLTQLRADRFASETAEKDLELAIQNKDVYQRFTRDRILSELKSEIEQQKAQLEASNYTLELSRQRQAEYEKQVANCRVTAPQAGTVVYANENDRDNSVIIEEGAELRDGQPIFYLPDPTRMQVAAKVNDSKINQVKEGQRVAVRVDTNPEESIEGRVRRVSPFPLPRRYYQAPIEYEVFVDIVETSPLIRSGLRGKVEIFVERFDDVTQVPVSSLVRRNDRYFVLVKDDAGVEPRPVEIGSNNERFVIIKQGIQPGENVLVDADNYRDDIDFDSVING